MSEWVKHAVGLPQYVQAFRQNSITVRDLKALCLYIAAYPLQLCVLEPDRILNLCHACSPWTFLP